MQRKKQVIELHYDQIFHPKKRIYWVWVPVVKPKPKINSEFNFIYFGIEIDKLLKFLTPISFWVYKMWEKYKKIFFLNFQKSKKFLDPTIFGCQKFDFYTKMYRIKFWIDFSFGLGAHLTRDPDSIYSLFGGKVLLWLEFWLDFDYFIVFCNFILKLSYDCISSKSGMA